MSLQSIEVQNAVAKAKDVIAAGIVPPEMRRFQRPDLDRHGSWLLERLVKAYPHLRVAQVAGWLASMVYNNDFMFLFQPNAVGLAQMERGQSLAPTPLVRERFVFAREPKYVEEASWFYVEWERWAKAQGAEVMLVNEGYSDVSAEQIRARFDNRRIFTRQQTFLRVGEKG